MKGILRKNCVNFAYLNKEYISNKREEAKECLERQAKRMKLQSDLSHLPALQGCNVRVNIPDVVLEKTTDGFYRLGNFFLLIIFFTYLLIFQIILF